MPEEYLISEDCMRYITVIRLLFTSFICMDKLIVLFNMRQKQQVCVKGRLTCCGNSHATTVDHSRAIAVRSAMILNKSKKSILNRQTHVNR